MLNFLIGCKEEVMKAVLFSRIDLPIASIMRTKYCEYPGIIRLYAIGKVVTKKG